MAVDSESTFSAELLQAAAKTSAYLPVSLNDPWKALMVPTRPPETVSRFPPSPAARFMAGARAAAASFAERPARAKFSVAVAASDMLKVESLAAAFMA